MYPILQTLLGVVMTTMLGLIAWLGDRAVRALDLRLAEMALEVRGINEALREHVNSIHQLDVRVSSIEATHHVLGCSTKG